MKVGQTIRFTASSGTAIGTMHMALSRVFFRPATCAALSPGMLIDGSTSGDSFHLTSNADRGYVPVPWVEIQIADNPGDTITVSDILIYARTDPAGTDR